MPPYAGKIWDRCTAIGRSNGGSYRLPPGGHRHRCRQYQQGKVNPPFQMHDLLPSESPVLVRPEGCLVNYSGQEPRGEGCNTLTHSCTGRSPATEGEEIPHPSSLRIQSRPCGVGVVLRRVPLSTTKPSGSDSSPNEPRTLASTPLSCRIRSASSGSNVTLRWCSSLRRHRPPPSRRNTVIARSKPCGSGREKRVTMGIGPPRYAGRQPPCLC
jgi:hypothetical protein